MPSIVCKIPTDPQPAFDVEDILATGFELTGGVTRDYDNIEYIITEIKKYKGSRNNKKLLKEKANSLINEYNIIRGFKCFPLIK